MNRLGLVLLVGLIDPRVTLKGTVEYCGIRSQPTLWRDAKVSAFDLRSNRRIATLLRRMDHVGTSNDSTTVYFARYDSLIVAVKRSHALARAISSSKGIFRMSYAPVDSVLVFAYDELEDETTFYAYRFVSGRASKRITLNIQGSCRG